MLAFWVNLLFSIVSFTKHEHKHILYFCFRFTRCLVSWAWHLWCCSLWHARWQSDWRISSYKVRTGDGVGRLHLQRDQLDVISFCIRCFIIDIGAIWRGYCRRPSSLDIRLSSAIPFCWCSEPLGGGQPIYFWNRFMAPSNRSDFILSNLEMNRVTIWREIDGHCDCIEDLYHSVRVQWDRDSLHSAYTPSVVVMLL